MRAALCVLVMMGCAVDEETVGDTEQATTTSNGVSLNGVSLNGVSLNGVSLNGVTLHAVTSGGPPLSGTAPVGSMWTGALSNGASLQLRIDSAQRGSGSNADLWFYGVSYRTSAGWSALCGADLALPVAGVWSASAAYAPSTTQFTFACRNKTVAKCVELGYKPHKGYANQLASCTRLLRGDYCGNGTPYTVDGTKLNLYDNVGIQKDTQGLLSLSDGLLWTKEAEWGPNGARCVTNIVTTRFLERRLTLPTCVLSLVSLSCGSFRPGTYLIDELPLLQ